MGKISAGSYDLNKWLYGGYDRDIVSVIYGASGSGKTTFCLLAAVSQARKGNKVVYIDTEGGFSVERVKQLIKSWNGDDDVEKVLENILLLKPTNFDEQRKAFVKLKEHLKDEVSLIVVDGMTILYRLDFASARSEGKEEMGKINSSLVRQMNFLAEIARKRNIPVLVTNQVYRWEDESKMVGGDILKYWGKCLIELIYENSKRTALLRKHRHMGEKSFVFQIFDGGVRKRGFWG